MTSGHPGIYTTLTDVTGRIHGSIGFSPLSLEAYA